MTKRPIGAPSRRTEKPARCGAIWGWLTCTRVHGHPGTHSDRGVHWSFAPADSEPPPEPGNG